MLPAPTLADISRHHEKYPEALCCILLAPTFSKLAHEAVIPRLGYLNHRTAQYIDFYCAGYGGYWRKQDFPDMEVIGDVTYEGGTVIPWAFSQAAFSNFVDELEQASQWKYSGETELIVLDAHASLEDSLVLDIAQMMADKAIERPSELFESLIRHAKMSQGRGSAYQFSDGNAPRVFATGILEVLSEGPKAIGKMWKAGRHFAIRNLAPVGGNTRLPSDAAKDRKPLDEAVSRRQDLRPEHFSANLYKAITVEPTVDAGRDLIRCNSKNEIEMLWASVREISDLRGIEKCTSLTELHLEGNRINSVKALASLVRLQKLCLNQNAISDIRPLALLRELTLLTLGSNRISDISALRSLLNLRYLYLSMNLIVDIEPLVPNCDAGGIGEGSSVSLSRNPLSDMAINVHIPYLRQRGVNVSFHPG